ncbi:MAG: excinuclease ABC subunit UvrC [Fusobacteriaceae bacterium]|nr:excinuclease ABC subunit UvrC [Fusobacteriaceae bacterium]
MVKDSLREKLQDIPENPGVYLMKHDRKIIYIGKAKNLKHRVMSYFNHEHGDEKTRELVRHIEDIDFILCKSEVDAFLLENNLIKKNMPKYNILLKDEKTYPYIRISREDFPNIRIIRTTKTLDGKNAVYFGPYPSGGVHLKNTIVRLFKIRDCNKDMKKVYGRPCLKYFMKSCLGPCVYKDVKEEYDQEIESAVDLLKGQGREVIARLKEKMEQASRNMDFERAILYREQIAELENAVCNQVIEYGKDLDEDIYTFTIQGETAFLCVLNVREGKIIGKVSSHMDLKGKIFEDLLEEAMLAFYDRHPIPKNIVLSPENEEKAERMREVLEEFGKRKIEFHFPRIKSRRRELLEMAEENLHRDVESYYRRKSVIEEGLYKIYNTLQLKRYPRKIECFDISNIQGKDAVASMSVSVEGRASKKDYRKFKITCKDTPDDFMMMREVITRRYGKLDPREFPDVVLIDGGLGQINAAGQVFRELGKEGVAELLSLAKRDEEVYKYGESVPYSFPKDQEALKIFQRVRDEAHRFGITYHRKLRSKRVISSELDKIAGIGPKRRKMLLETFGSVAGVAAQSVEALSGLVPKDVAIKIKETIKNREQHK